MEKEDKDNRDFKAERRNKLLRKKKDKFKSQGKPKLFEKGRKGKWKYEG